MAGSDVNQQSRLATSILVASLGRRASSLVTESTLSPPVASPMQIITSKVDAHDSDDNESSPLISERFVPDPHQGRDVGFGSPGTFGSVLAISMPTVATPNGYLLSCTFAAYDLTRKKSLIDGAATTIRPRCPALDLSHLIDKPFTSQNLHWNLRSRHAFRKARSPSVRRHRDLA